jgi:hypothetical protein
VVGVGVPVLLRGWEPVQVLGVEVQQPQVEVEVEVEAG